MIDGTKIMISINAKNQFMGAWNLKTPAGTIQLGLYQLKNVNINLSKVL